MRGQKKAAYKKVVIGLTGSFGSGKSTVASLLKRRGATVIDADRIARGLLAPGTAVYNKVVALFGSGIVRRNKRINRRALAERVFSNKQELVKLNRLIHPKVIRLVKAGIAHTTARYVVVDAPLLIESGLHTAMDLVVVVTSRRKDQLQRLRKATGLSEKAILARIRQQMPLSQKIRFADFIIDNSGSVQDARQQVDVLLRKVNVPLALPRRSCVSPWRRASG
ncbi:MAG: dephospho-CoA kinase [Candidatus Omnitrophica bacterium]|nr:dephospho-CoA kinase [Candidatus Omnitrophota bacterium]